MKTKEKNENCPTRHHSRIVLGLLGAAGLGTGMTCLLRRKRTNDYDAMDSIVSFSSRLIAGM